MLLKKKLNIKLNSLTTSISDKNNILLRTFDFNVKKINKLHHKYNKTSIQLKVQLA